jgi:hypothetical protein
MYWDPAKSNYIPVEDTTTTANPNDPTNATMGSTEPKDKAEKVKTAQKVAKVCAEQFNCIC